VTAVVASLNAEVRDPANSPPTAPLEVSFTIRVLAECLDARLQEREKRTQRPGESREWIVHAISGITCRRIKRYRTIRNRGRKKSSPGGEDTGEGGLSFDREAPFQ